MDGVLFLLLKKKKPSWHFKLFCKVIGMCSWLYICESVNTAEYLPCSVASLSGKATFQQNNANVLSCTS